MKSLATLDQKMQDRIPADILSKLQTSMQGLEMALLKQDPEMKNHLRESHRLLISYPETVHLLEDNEIAGIIKASQQHMKTQIISEAAKGKGSRGKSKITVDDL